MNPRIDILERKLAVTSDLRARIDLENRIAFEMRDSEMAASIQKSRDLLLRLDSLEVPYIRGIADAHFNIGTKFIITGNLEPGEIHLKEAEDLYRQENFTDGIAKVNIVKSNYHWTRGEMNHAMELIFNGLKLIENHEDPLFHGFGHYFLGTFYSDMLDLENSLKHLNQARDYFEQAAHTDGIARSHNSITLAYRRQNKPELAIHHGRVSLEIYKMTGNQTGLARSLNDLGSLHVDQGDLHTGIRMLEDSLAIRRKVNSKQAIITTLTELGLAYLFEERTEAATTLLYEALAMAVESNARVKQVRILKTLSDVEKKRENYKKALELLGKAYSVESDQVRIDAETRVKNIEVRLEAEKRISESELEKVRNIELKRAYDEIEEKSRSITDSIRYAKHIQSAILPGKEVFSDCFNEFFIFYSPRDIVSGDFYWARKTGDVIQVAVVDCTGHGVPGALMSMLGYSLLNQNIDSVPVNQPGLVLDYLRQGIINGLKQESLSGTSDGMDIGFVNIDLNTQKIHFAGANRPLLLVDPSTGNFKEIKGDKFPAGIHPSFEGHDFTHHEIDFKKGEVAYLFTDGFYDQFGGPRGKKYKFKRFRELLLKAASLHINEQHQMLEQEFNSWRGELEQVDDVTVAGIKL